MTKVTEQQAIFIRSLVASIEGKKVVGPKKPSRWNDPVRAHSQHVKQAHEILALLNAGALTAGAASSHISSLTLWAKF